MVELGNLWDQDDEFDDELLHILDFPIECLEGDGLEADWDMSNSEFLGPIPSSVLIGPATILNEKINRRPPRLFPRRVALITGTPEQKQLSNTVNASGSHIQESAAFETHSPISVLEGSGSCLGGKSLSFKPEKAIPVRSRSKRVRHVGINPWLLAAPILSTSQKTLNTKKSKESKKCHHCESTKTPQWREGPMGPKSLCNACGVRYRSGRLFPEYRPASSPTFVSSKHSNNHKKVIKMRNKAKESAGKIKVAPMSLQPPAETDEPPPSPQSEFVAIAGALEQKQLSNHVVSSTLHICQQNNSVNIQEPGAIETQCQSPVSLLQSSRSHCGEKSQGNALTINRSNECKNDENLLDVSDCVHEQNASSDRFLVIRKCVHCDTKTPQWRDVPVEPLCNACRARYLAGPRFPEHRPAAIPTFVPLKHTDSHKRIVEMKNIAKQTAGKNMVAPISSQPAAKTEEQPPSPQRKFVSIAGARAQKGVFETQSPISHLQCSSSYLSLKPDNAIPVRNRSKRVRPAGIDPPLVALNTSNSKRSRKVERKCAHCESTKTPRWREGPTGPLCRTCEIHYQTRSLLPAPPSSPLFRPMLTRKCAHCEATETPQWREGPMGAPLCNACGVRYRKGHLLPEYRPVGSPSFVPSKHSNSHKKVLAMRNSAKQTSGKITVAPMSYPQPAASNTGERPPSPVPELFFD